MNSINIVKYSVICRPKVSKDILEVCPVRRTSPSKPHFVASCQVILYRYEASSKLTKLKDDSSLSSNRLGNIVTRSCSDAIGASKDEVEADEGFHNFYQAADDINMFFLSSIIYTSIQDAENAHTASQA
jgi:hypothetical protein